MDGNTQQEEDTQQEGNDALRETYDAYSFAKERRAILTHILEEILTSVRNQTKKRPDAVVNLYKVTRINNILREIREHSEGTGYEDLLELIDPPKQTEQNGVTVTEGLSYSDLEILLDHYHTILYFIRPAQR